MSADRVSALRARVGDCEEFGEMESCCVRVEAGRITVIQSGLSIAMQI